MKIFTGDIKELTLHDEYFRKVLFTGSHAQLVLMSLNPGEDIGEEIHTVDQILFFIQGEGKAILDGEEYEIKENSVFCVPAGTKHNFINSTKGIMKLYTVYAPVEHRDGVIHKTKIEAQNDKEDHP